MSVLIVRRPGGLVFHLEQTNGRIRVVFVTDTLRSDVERWSTRGLVDIYEGRTRHTPPNHPDFLTRLAEYIRQHCPRWEIQTHE